MLSKTVFLTVLLAAGCIWAQENKQTPAPGTAPAAAPASPHPTAITAEDKARKNPQKFTEVSVSRGKKIYLTQCALCHGDKGDGKSELAADMKLSMRDFTNPDTLNAQTDGELFAIISTGKDPMPAQAGRMTEVQRWNLVNFLRALSGKTPAPATGNEPEENIILVPPKH